MSVKNENLVKILAIKSVLTNGNYSCKAAPFDTLIICYEWFGFTLENDIN